MEGEKREKHKKSENTYFSQQIRTGQLLQLQHPFWERSTNLASFGRFFAPCHLFGNTLEESSVGTPAYPCPHPRTQAPTSSGAPGLRPGNATFQGTQLSPTLKAGWEPSA